MEYIGCAGLPVTAVTASGVHVAGVRVENIPVHADADGHRSYDLAVTRVHHDQHARGGGTLTSTANVQAAIRFVHRHANRRNAPRSRPFVFDGEFHRVVFDHLTLILVILEDAPLAVGYRGLWIGVELHRANNFFRCCVHHGQVHAVAVVDIDALGRWVIDERVGIDTVRFN